MSHTFRVFMEHILHHDLMSRYMLAVRLIMQWHKCGTAQSVLFRRQAVGYMPMVLKTMMKMTKMMMAMMTMKAMHYSCKASKRPDCERSCAREHQKKVGNSAMMGTEMTALLGEEEVEEAEVERSQPS